MTSNDVRASALESALRAALARDRAALEAVLTDDVRAWSPALATSSREELIDELEHRDESFSDFALSVQPLDVSGDYACVEWTVEMTHTGAIALTAGTNIEPSGIRVSVHGSTIAEFEDDRICSVRQYWDELAILEQLGVLERRR